MSKYLDKKKVLDYVDSLHQQGRTIETRLTLQVIYYAINQGEFDVDLPTPNEIELFPNRPLFEDGYSLKYYHRMVSDWHTDAIMYLKRRVEALEGRG